MQEIINRQCGANEIGPQIQGPQITSERVSNQVDDFVHVISSFAIIGQNLREIDDEKKSKHAMEGFKKKTSALINKDPLVADLQRFIVDCMNGVAERTPEMIDMRKLRDARLVKHDMSWISALARDHDMLSNNELVSAISGVPDARVPRWKPACFVRTDEDRQYHRIGLSDDRTIVEPFASSVSPFWEIYYHPGRVYSGNDVPPGYIGLVAKIDDRNAEFSRGRIGIVVSESGVDIFEARARHSQAATWLKMMALNGGLR